MCLFVFSVLVRIVRIRFGWESFKITNDGDDIQDRIPFHVQDVCIQMVLGNSAIA